VPPTKGLTEVGAGDATVSKKAKERVLDNSTQGLQLHIAHLSCQIWPLPLKRRNTEIIDNNTEICGKKSKLSSNLEHFTLNLGHFYP